MKKLIYIKSEMIINFEYYDEEKYTINNILVGIYDENNKNEIIPDIMDIINSAKIYTNIDFNGYKKFLSDNISNVDVDRFINNDNTDSYILSDISIPNDTYFYLDINSIPLDKLKGEII